MFVFMLLCVCVSVLFCVVLCCVVLYCVSRRLCDELNTCAKESYQVS
jgi:hypothetical protein